MQKWEYCDAELIHGKGTQSFSISFLKEGGKPDIWQGDYATGIAKLGKLGWELVAATRTTGQTDKSNLLFKRHLEEKEEEKAKA